MSLPHEPLVDLFRRRPSLLAELCPELLPASASWQVLDPDTTEPGPLLRRADLGLDPGLPGGLVAVLELPGTVDRDKRWSWVQYQAGLRARLRRAVVLVVLALSEEVARWARTPIDTGQPGSPFVPLVLGPSQLLAMEARCPPSAELAVLLPLVESEGARGFERAIRVLDAVRPLDDERSRIYADLVIAHLDAVARALMESFVNQNYEYRSEFARKYIGLGRAEGVAEGKAEGKAEAILTLLRARGLSVPPDVEARIHATHDLAELDGLLVRALRAPSAEALYPGV